MAGSEEPLLHPASYYRRQAVGARQIAEGVTTQAVKARLLNEARQYDQLAAKAENAAIEYGNAQQISRPSPRPGDL
jgi:hypothetical protein